MISLESEVQDIKRRLTDLESDTPTDKEVRALERRVVRLERAVGISQ